MIRVREYIGEKAFYAKAARIALPIMMQGSIYNLIGLLNNIMVGRVSTVQMNGVAVVNQLMFVFYSCISGIFGGIGVFTAQFSGKGDEEGIRYTFRFKLVTSFLLSAATILLLGIWGKPLIQSYLSGEGLAADAEASLAYGMGYLWIMLVGVPPYALINVYSSTLRELGQTKMPMFFCVFSMVVSLVLNYVLIFGFVGIPAMGCYGAAAATLVARFIELAGVDASQRTQAPLHTGRVSLTAYPRLARPANCEKKRAVRAQPATLVHGRCRADAVLLCPRAVCCQRKQHCKRAFQPDYCCGERRRQHGTNRHRTYDGPVGSAGQNPFRLPEIHRSWLCVELCGRTALCAGGTIFPSNLQHDRRSAATGFFLYPHQCTDPAVHLLPDGRFWRAPYRRQRQSEFDFRHRVHLAGMRCTR